jgi:carbonic anhydrase
MRTLIEGFQRFRREVFEARRALFERLAEGQHPEALFITCSDSRIDPNLITHAEPGQLFFLRNIVPAYGTGGESEAAAVEFAVSVLKVRDIIVCGHSHCGAMKGALNPESVAALPAVAGWVAQAAATAQAVRDENPDCEPAALLDRMVQRNVLAQLENLRTHPVVAAALERGELELHGWVYRFEAGEVLAHSPASGAFVPLTDAEAARALSAEPGRQETLKQA